MEVQELYNSFANTWEEMKGVLAERDQEVKKLGSASAETQEKLDRLNNRLDDMEAKLQRPLLSSHQQAHHVFDDASVRAKQAFDIALRQGYDALSPEQKQHVPIVSLSEAKAMNMGTDAAGGYLAFPEFYMQILKEMLPYSPIRTVATVHQTSNKSVQFRKRSTPLSATWVKEYQDDGTPRPTSTPQYGLEEIFVHELFAEVDVTEQLLEDSAFDIQRELISDAGEQFGIAEGRAFCVGTGTGQPEGVLTNADVVSLTAKAATYLTYNDLVSLYYAVPEAYARNGTWAMNRKSVAQVRLLVDKNGQPLWQPSVAPGAPSTILGAPYIECPDFPDLAANATALMFGDFRQGYIIVDRIGIVVKRLNEALAKLGLIGFIFRKRVGGAVVMAPALRKLKMAATDPAAAPPQAVTASKG